MAGMPYFICSTAFGSALLISARMRSRIDRTSTGYWEMYSSIVAGVVAIRPG
jgi:hypothetical protein